jgi:microsomal epoxide hydrolase
MSPTPTAFHLSVPDDEIADLRARLALTRFPDQAPDGPWAYGTDVDFMRHLVSYWQTGFDWRTAEARLNAFSQFTVPLDGIELHFLHVPGNGPSPIPLLLSHGWPGSVFEFIELIPRLTDPARFGGDPADAVTVVAPSLPGYGLSFRPGQKRFRVEEIAGTMARLMTEVLGYGRFAAQGGDWGSFVTSRIAFEHPERVIGLHLNMVPLRRDLALGDPSPEERAYLDELAVFLKEETGYQWIQGTRPQTLAFGLTDSPAGLAAWIVEKFRAWSDCGGEVESVFTLDELLANISLYWFTGCIGASFHPYWGRMHGPWPIPDSGPITPPMAYAAFPKEIVRPPRSMAERTYTDIRHWTVMQKGGHFAAMEQPEALASDILDFLRPLRQAL